MPPKRRTNNKKKNKGKAGRGRHCRQQASAPNNRNATTSSNDATLEGTAPTLWEKLRNRESALGEEFPTVYLRYKNATNRFIKYMTKVCPDEMGEGRSTNSLLVAADRMARTGHVIERSVLRDLKLAIRMRTRVAKSVYGGGDAGHKHFLDILKYCWYVLNSLHKSERENDDTKLQEENPDVNHFAALMEENDEEENVAEEDEEMFPSNPVSRPSLSGREPLSLDELMHGDDRNDSVIFLLTLDEIMAAIAEHYKNGVLKNLQLYQRIRCPTTAIIEEMMEAAVATNMAIQQVQTLEMDLMVQHEHLTTPYRLLATLVLPELIQSIMSTIQARAEDKGCTEKDISIFLGDCIECCFRDRSDPYRKEDIVQDFCRRWQVDSVGTTEIEQIYEGLEKLVVFEVPVATEKKYNAHIASEKAARGLPGSHSWIQNMPFIGGDRAIQHTLRLLQTFGGVIHVTPQNRGFEAKRGFFGKSPWVPGRSHKIDDLDELVMSDIMPKLMLMCRKGIIGNTKLPQEDELCPLFVLMRKYVEQPEKPVSWSILFAIHALSTAVLEVGPMFNKIVNVSKSAFENYFNQLDWTINLAQNNPESIGDLNSAAGKNWMHNMISVVFLKNLGLPAFGDRMLWNPLFAGTIFSYLNYFGNLEGGCANIDCHAQLRITLHLFHALLVTGIVRRGEVPFLDMVYDNFRHCKAIWEGRRLPRRGEFAYRFWICFGSDIAGARKMADEAREIILRMPRTLSGQTTGKGKRKLVPIEPAEISKSFRRICNRDFHDVVDKYHTPEQRRRNKGSDIYHLMVRINDTCDAIEEEQQMLSLNFLSCGAITEQFVNSLGRILLREPFLARAAAATMNGGDQRQVFVYFFAQYLLGALDFADDPLHHEFMEVPLGQASSQFMGTFFNSLNRDKLQWFQPTKEEE